MVAQATTEYNPFAETMKPKTFRASLAKMAIIDSKFPTASGGIKKQVYVVLVRWNYNPETQEYTGESSTFSRYLSGDRAIRALGAGLRRLLGKDPMPSEIDAQCPIHLEWEERPQADWKDKDGVFHPNRDLLVPTALVKDIIPETITVACGEARITRTGAEVTEEANSTSAFDADAFLTRIIGMSADDVAGLAGEFSDQGLDAVAYIASGQALNMLLARGNVVVNEEGVVTTTELPF